MVIILSIKVAKVRQNGEEMKKLITTIILSICLAFTLSGCGQATLDYQGAYWHENSAGFIGYNETNVYSVDVVSTKPSYSTEIKNEYVKLVIEQGDYVTNLKMLKSEEYGNHYVYTTSLIIKGKYVFESQEYSFEDDVITTTLFKNFSNGFSPISSKKTSSCSTTLLATSTGYDIVKTAYEFTVEYGEKDAILKRTIINSLNEESKDQTTIKKYAKNNYIDNELLLLMPRAFKYDSPFTKNFDTISAVDKRNISMYFTTANTENKTTISTFETNYELNGAPASENNSLQAILFTTAIDDTFKGFAIDSYYLIDQATHKHKMIRSYTTLNDNLGYLQYSLVKSTDKTQIN